MLFEIIVVLVLCIDVLLYMTGYGDGGLFKD